MSERQIFHLAYISVIARRIDHPTSHTVIVVYGFGKNTLRLVNTLFSDNALTILVLHTCLVNSNSARQIFMNIWQTSITYICGAVEKIKLFSFKQKTLQVGILIVHYSQI